MNRLRGHELHRWLFRDKEGKEMKFEQRRMPFAVFGEDAVWGGSCSIGDCKCRVRIRHNSEGEKGKRLEIWFPHEEFDEEVPYERATLVGYMQVIGSFQMGTGKCLFKSAEKD